MRRKTQVKWSDALPTPSVLLVVLAVICWAPKARTKAAAVECPGAAGETSVTTRPGKVKREVKKLQKQGQRSGIHALDLPAVARQHMRDLDASTAAKDWCKVLTHIEALQSALDEVQVDELLAAAKIQRLEAWVRGGAWKAGVVKAVERLVATAASHLESGKVMPANRQLNKAMNKLLGLKSNWELPDQMPTAAAPTKDETKEPERVAVSQEDVEAGCPEFVGRTTGTSGELAVVLSRLSRAMDSRQVRPVDIKQGPELLADLKDYQRLNSTWPALRAVCVLLFRVNKAEVDLGMVMGRFHKIAGIRESRGIPKGSESRFRELVRAASDAIAVREFAKAHEHLEALLVLMGDPAQPSGVL